ncbi:MAG: hypothetical protein L6V81_03155 [Clostridium sp.]|nr:MAG: hypothetical protein L6V81_03155 [Clostridium sp.]
MLKVYDIKATMNDGYSEETHSYKGFKLKEIFDSLGIKSYNEVMFSSNGGLDVTFFLKMKLMIMYFCVFLKEIVYI